jgi:hypothetical protein
MGFSLGFHCVVLVGKKVENALVSTGIRQMIVISATDGEVPQVCVASGVATTLSQQPNKPRLHTSPGPFKPFNTCRGLCPLVPHAPPVMDDTDNARSTGMLCCFFNLFSIPQIYRYFG